MGIPAPFNPADESLALFTERVAAKASQSRPRLSCGEEAGELNE